ncbi:MAG: ankyrin repeat domain-containing protein [Elusimicrobia bacterium]|nr:ankyrin repeat domain-containing protein [Elusimicrobiota bacterium]
MSPKIGIHKAAEKGDVELLQKLILEGVDVNARDKDDCSPLHIAAAHADPAALRVLLSAGARPDAVTKEERLTPLHVAALEGRLDAAEALLEAGADPFAWNYMSERPLDAALNREHMEVAECLFARITKEEPGALGSPLHAAVVIRDLSLIEKLLRRGIGVDVRDHDGDTPLHWVFTRRSEAFVRLILRHCPETAKTRIPRRQDDPLEIVRHLLSKGADVRAVNACGETLLHRVLQWSTIPGCMEAAEIYLAQGAAADAADITGWTPLMLAACSGRTEFAKRLVERGAQLEIVRNGWTALQYACHHGKLETVRWLVETGADVNSAHASKYLSVPLHSAAFMGHPEIVALLLEHGADISIKDGKGNDALAHAKKSLTTWQVTGDAKRLAPYEETIRILTSAKRRK